MMSKIYEYTYKDGFFRISTMARSVLHTASEVRKSLILSSQSLCPLLLPRRDEAQGGFYLKSSAEHCKAQDFGRLKCHPHGARGFCLFVSCLAGSVRSYLAGQFSSAMDLLEQELDPVR